MLPRKLKSGVLVLEWLHIYATIYYFNYLFFYMRLDFGFTNRDNLSLAALNGLLYVPASVFGGRFAQKHGYFAALRLGLGIMALTLALGSQLPGVTSQFLIMVAWTLGVCFTWPALEALVSERETRKGLARIVGLYNVVWASGAAVAYFTGGALLENLGRESLFWLPAVLHSFQFGLTFWLQRRTATLRAANPSQLFEADCLPASSTETESTVMVLAPTATTEVIPAGAKSFLRMAWLANPFAYVAMNTIVPLLPDLAARMNLSTAAAGFVGSVWMFARLAAFIALWRWPGWHYRFGWLAGSYVLMVLCFGALLLVPNLAVIVIAQFVFGLAVGLIYYSSLFYSMDVGETKGEHGGIHEALIGLGLFVGPAVGTVTLRFLPGVPNVGIWAVSGVLVLGFFPLLLLQAGAKRISQPALRL